MQMKVAIVGGGISGLACAYYLQRAGVEAVVFDPTPGGLIGTVHVEGCILETGPESWLASKPWAEQLIRELGMGDQLTGSNDASAAPTFSATAVSSRCPKASNSWSRRASFRF